MGCLGPGYTVGFCECFSKSIKYINYASGIWRRKWNARQNMWISICFLSIHNLKYSTEKDLSNVSPSINIPKAKYSVRRHGQSERLANRGKRGTWRGIQNGGESHKNISQSVSSLLQKGFYKIPALCQTEGTQAHSQMTQRFLKWQGLLIIREGTLSYLGKTPRTNHNLN